MGVNKGVFKISKGRGYFFQDQIREGFYFLMIFLISKLLIFLGSWSDF